MISQSSTLQSTTQKYLEIFDITNDVIILQDGSCSLVLKTSAINFDLFSEEEQDATIYAYAALLNSLSFPIEIVVRSQKKDVSAYLDLLKNQEVKAYTPTTKKQIREYRAFIEQLVQERNVLDKKFYIVITVSALELGLVAPSSVVPIPSAKKTPVNLDKYSILEKAIPTLQPRRDHIMHQCARIGLYTQQVTTQELIQLFYSIYNPEASKGQKVQNTGDYTTPLVSADLRTPAAQATPAPSVPVTEVPPTVPTAGTSVSAPPVTPAAPMTAPSVNTPSFSVAEQPTISQPSAPVPPTNTSPTPVASVAEEVGLPTPTPPPMETPAPIPTPTAPVSAPVVSQMPTMTPPVPPATPPVESPSASPVVPSTPEPVPAAQPTSMGTIAENVVPLSTDLTPPTPPVMPQ
jgi:hypothetical protein